MKLKKLFFSILTVGILGLTSFSSAFSENDIPESAILYSGSVDFAYSGLSNTNLMYFFPTLNYPYTQDIPFSYYCAYFYNFDQGSLGDNAWLTFGFGPNYWDHLQSLNRDSNYKYPQPGYIVDPLRLWLDVDGLDEDGGLMCAYSYRKYINMGIAELRPYNRTYKFDYIIFDYNKLSFGSSVDCSQDSNYLQCLEDKNQLIGQVSTLSGNLNSCQSDLSSCLNGIDVSYQACVENLSGCQSDLNNMTNYNDSLNSQLNECLAELPVPCEGTGCEETIITDQRFSFFRENDGERFSLPVANNVFLPQGYRAYVDSGVVAIGRLQDKPKISVDDESFFEINELYYYFFEAVIVLGFFALFMWFIKSLYTSPFTGKNKS